MIVEDMIRVWSRSSFSLALSDVLLGGDSKGGVMVRFSSRSSSIGPILGKSGPLITPCLSVGAPENI